MFYSRKEQVVCIVLVLAWIIAGTTALTFYLRDHSHLRDWSFFIAASFVVPLELLWLVFGHAAAFTAGSYIAVLIVYYRFLAQDRAVLLALPFFALSMFVFHLYRKFTREKIEKAKLQYEKNSEKLNLKSDEKARLLSTRIALQEKEKKYSSLTDILRFFSKNLAHAEIIDYIIKVVSRTIDKFAVLTFYLVNQKTQSLELKKVIFHEQAPFRLKLKKGDEFDHWVFKHKQPLIVSDATKDFRFDVKTLFEAPVHERFLSLIATPLVHGEHFKGVLRLNSMKPETYAFDDLRILNITGNLCAMALENAMLYETTQKLAIIDDLTGLHKHQHFMEKIEEEISYCMMHNTSYGMVIFDIDNFKDYNDQYGHIAGDIVLRHVARIIMNNVPKEAVAARYGGEEFSCFCHGKELGDMVAIAETIRKQLEGFDFYLRRKLTKVTLSGGVAFCKENKLMPQDLIRQADFMLYKAKREGRNQICAE